MLRELSMQLEGGDDAVKAPKLDLLQSCELIQ